MANCNCKNATPQELRFRRCARGYLVSATNREAFAFTPDYAFERIEDVAAWLVEQYSADEQ